MAPMSPHRQPRLLALVFVGGALGTAARAAIEAAAPAAPGTWPWATFGINLAGAFLLGLLLETLDRRAARLGPGPAPRLFLGTGILGGFTTYSAFAVETVHLPLPLAILYAVLTATMGLAAAGLGFRWARSRGNVPVPEPGP
ncbi:MAG TPA: CrcB family protein [Intrasporangiaceae bacterium]|nr:CrcB family protein [Intrasporangiaceae bacterium]